MRVINLILRGAMAITALVLSITLGHSQTTSTRTITGTVIDSLNNTPLAYASVAILNSEDVSLTGVLTDAKGKFKLQFKAPEEYKISISYLGYSSFDKSIRTADYGTTINLGTIYLMEGVNIESVNVVAAKPLVTADAEKLTYSVEADPESDTSSLVDIMRKVPQLSVDADGNVQLNGQSDFKVLVNGRSSTMMESNFTDIIKSMPANAVKDIEVITNPSTKYEAEGVGGIINIITNRNQTMNGYSGRLGLTVSNPESYNGSAYISAQFGKFSFSANGNVGWSRSKSTGFTRTDYLQNNSFMESNSNGISKGLQRFISLEASYEIDSLNLLTLSLMTMGGNRTSTMDRDIATGMTDDEANAIHTGDKTITGGSHAGWEGSLNYQRSFKKKDQLLTVSYELEFDPTTSDSDITETDLHRKSSNKARGTEHTLQIDYFDPLTKKHSIEAGIKYRLRINTSDTRNTLWDDGIGGWIDDPNRFANDLNYDQHIFGAYGGYVFKLAKFTAKAGFRAEGTWNDGYSKLSKTDNKEFKNSDFDFIPYVNFAYMINQSQSVVLSYTQRLRRPGIWFLNPYVDDNDKYNISYGNPDLESVKAHSFNAQYRMFTPSSSLFLGANFSFSNNSITEITTVETAITDPDTGEVYDRTSRTYGNIGKERRIGFNASYSYRLGAVFSVNANLRGAYTFMESMNYDRPLKNEGLNFGGNLGAYVTLWKGARFSVNGGIFSRGVSLQGRSSIFNHTSFGLTQKLFKEKMDISVSVSNPFSKFQKWESWSEDSTFKTHSKFENTGRRINFYIGWRFGKTEIQVKKARRGINNDDSLENGSSPSNVPTSTQTGTQNGAQNGAGAR